MNDRRFDGLRLAVVLMVMCSACSDGGGGGGGGTSGASTAALTCGGEANICYEYSGPQWAESRVKELCNATGQAGFRGTPCPTDPRVGRCRYRPDRDADREIIFIYYSPEYTEASAKKACAGLGDAGLWLQ